MHDYSSFYHLVYTVFYLLVAASFAESNSVLIFQISFTVFGEVVTHNLKPKGDRIPVTKENRQGIHYCLNFLLEFWVSTVQDIYNSTG